VVCAEMCRLQLFTEWVSSLFSWVGVLHVNLKFLFFYLLEASVTLTSTLILTLIDRLPCSVIWSHVLNNSWDMLLKNYYRQNTSWLSVSNNAFDHEISGSDYYPER
jgi:hypothetical protein